MKTPRIEEMVKEGQKIVCDYLDEVRRLLARLPGKVKPNMFTNWLRTALTEAHQAGRDEAVEIVKSLIDHQAEYGGQPFGDIYNSAYKKVIKALQDNK